MCEFLELGVGGYIQHRERSRHVQERALWHALAGVGAVTEAAERDAGQLAAVRGDRDPVRIPGRGNVAEDSAGLRLQYRDGVEARLSDIDPPAVGRRGHARQAEA